MVDVRPLRLRLVNQSWADRVSSPAHDALTPADRRAHIALNPDSYMAVTRGLEDVLPGEAHTPEDLLGQGRLALDRLRQSGAFAAERKDEFYIYRLEVGSLSLTGIVAGVSVSDYIAGRVRIHEHVKANRALHLANHLDVVGVQSSPIAMAHRPNPAIADLTAALTEAAPLIKVTLPDGLTQSVWAVTDPNSHSILESAFRSESLYLIDGHHRAAAAATFRAASGPGLADWMLSAIFPADELFNAPHHRILRPQGGVAEALEAIGRKRRLRLCSQEEVSNRGADEIGLLAEGQWYCLTLPLNEGSATPEQLLANLDPSRFQDQVVGPVFHLDPAVGDRSLGYMAGNRSLQGLEEAVGAGEMLALMRDVPIDTLLKASDSGLIMPPKSTYFQPKIRSGVFLRATTV